MSEENYNVLKTRIKHKNNTPDFWSQETDFNPLQGELIIYNEKVPKIKIGDGVTNVEQLPFITDNYITVELDSAEPDTTVVKTNSELLGGKAPEYYLFKENILHNSYFPRPVNQRGKTSYSGAVQYTIDRWKTTNANTKVEIVDDGIRLTNTTSGGGYLQQTLENSAQYLGKTYTFCAMLENGTIVVNSATLPSTFPSTITQYATLIYNGITVGAIQVSTNSVWVRVWSNTSENTRFFKWAALYEGSYTAETLPPYVYKGYATELAECQRFYRRTNAVSTYATLGMGYARTDTMAWINIPRTRMRIEKPTITLTGGLIAYCGSGSSIPITSVEMDKISDNYVRFKVYVESGFTVGYPILLANETDTNVYMEENADL